MCLEPEQISKTIKEITSLFPQHILVCGLLTKNFFEQFGASVHSKIVNTGAEFTVQSENPKEVFLHNNYMEIESIPMVNSTLSH